MHEVDFSFGSGYNHHECDSVTDGDWVIFRCPICEDYERKINVVTGETIAKNISSIVSHSGRHLPSQHRAMGLKAELN